MPRWKRPQEFLTRDFAVSATATVGVASFAVKGHFTTLDTVSMLYEGRRDDAIAVDSSVPAFRVVEADAVRIPTGTRLDITGEGVWYVYGRDDIKSGLVSLLVSRNRIT